MKNQALIMLCIGGQKTSLLAYALHLGGMYLGNEKTGWKDHYFNSHCEHSELTQLPAIYNTLEPIDPREEEKFQNRYLEILNAYKTEAKRNGWRFFGIKTTSGICNNKWSRVNPLWEKVFPDALYLGLLRKPLVDGDGLDEGWSNVYPARLHLVSTGRGIFLPFPEVFESLEIMKFITTLGLSWSEEVIPMFLRKYKEEDRRFNNPVSEEQYHLILEKSRENFNSLFGVDLNITEKKEGE